MKKLLKKSLLFGLAALLGILTFNTPAYGAEALSGIYNSGTDKTVTIAKAGKYTFNLYGAQGGNYSSYTGGKGGSVSFSKELSVGDTVRIVTGAGGGDGTLTDGGGYSAIYINGTLVGVAGGGGGATQNGAGGNGGISGSGNNGTSLKGSSSSAVSTSGGGAGYKGGTSGSDHVHSGNTTNGGDCYKTPVYHKHVNSAGTVQSSTTLYTTSAPGGCYVASGHTHDKTGACPYSEYRTHCDTIDDNGAVYKKCPDCGTKYTGGVYDNIQCYYCWRRSYSCGSPTNTYVVGCGKTTSTVVSYALSCTQGSDFVQSKGGSNYINTSLVTSISNEGGVNGTDSYTAGKATIEIIGSVSVALDTNKPTGTNNEPEVDVSEVTVIANHFKSELPTPRLIGYEFLGWTTAKNSTTYVVPDQEHDAIANPTLYAQWSPIDMTIKLDKNNIYADDIATSSYTYKYDAVYNLPTPTSKYSNFKNWATDAAGTKKITNGSTKVQKSDPEPELVVYAQWTPAQITLKFDATTNGGTISGSSSKTVTNESVVGSLPTATKSGYNFLGWFTSSTGGDPVTEGTLVLFDKSSTHTLYAQFEPKVTDWPFGYTGAVQTWTAPSSGYYLFEAYGAQGASINATQIGGKGGFVSGVKFLNKGDVIYINVGGQGQPFNGGGIGAVKNGGGGTDFRLNGNNPSNRFLVAGGGGGATDTKVGGHGGVSGSGNHTDLVNGQGNNQEGGAGGGGGYYGGTSGYLIRHFHKRSGCTQHYHGGSCYSKGYHHCTINSSSDGWSCNSPSGHCAGYCSYCGGHWAYCYLEHSYSYLSCTRSEGYQCGMSDGQIIGQAPAYGGSNYVDSTLYYQKNEGGVRQGNGYAKITAMYTVVLDTNKPSTTNHYTANATNIPFIDNVDTLLQEKNLPYTTPNYSRFESTGDDTNKTTYGLYFVRDMFTYDSYEKLPVPTLKGWKFLGWYTYPQIDAGVKVTDSTQVKITNGLTLLDNHILYAHWEPETYYIKYYMNNTNKNVYGDNYTDPVAKFDTTLNGAVKSGSSTYTYNASEDCYIQTVKYDHNIEVLPNYYAKTGYYFKNWTNKADTTLAGTKGTGTGTGKQTGTGYYESDILTQVKNGETFQAGKGNFNYITNEKALSLGTATQPIWSYGNQTVVLYATWEPIKYNLRFNGTDNWNDSSSFTTGAHTKQDSYLQKIGNGTTIRYDQIFTLNPNQFTRKAPHMVVSPQGIEVPLYTGYGHIGWGFGLDEMKYNASKTYDLLSMNIKYDNEQALNSDSDTDGRDYSEAQANVKNVISEAGVKAITKYISDWSNARTDSNRKDKSELNNKVIESNLHSLWRRNSNDDHENTGAEGNIGCPNGNCSCPDDGNGNCLCPSDDCPDIDKDGTCDCHDPDPDDPTVPDRVCPDGCMCPDNGKGGCDCPSSFCPDADGDGVCDCHDPAPSDPSIPNNGDKCPCDKDGDGICPCPSDNCPDKDDDGVCDNHDKDPNDPTIPNGGGDDDCPCGSDGNGGCICPSDNCPDVDGDGVCDNHDPDTSNPSIPDSGDDNDDNCPCGDKNGDGDCDCPSDTCPDKDKDGVCDNHDPNPNDPNIPNDGRDDDGDCPCGDSNGDGNCDCPSENCPDRDNDKVCDNHDPDPNNPFIPNDGKDDDCPCGTGPNSECICPSDSCPDKDGDGICDNHDPDPNNPDIPNINGDDNDDCPCGSDGNGNCICPSDDCPDKDGDGVCDNHDPDPNNPHVPSKCPCGTDENGDCICPSDSCPDKDGDGVCDNHDPDPNNPHIPSKCPCGTDENGECVCPSDDCPDSDGDDICDNHDPDPNNPHIPSKCPCGTDENGNCICPSDNCPDKDKDGVCDNHDPDPNNL